MADDSDARRIDLRHGGEGVVAVGREVSEKESG